MKSIRIIFKLILYVCLVCLFSCSLRAQSSIQEMVDKGKDLMIEGKYAEAKVQFQNAIALDAKLAPTLQPYFEKMAPKSPSKSNISSFSLSHARLLFKGIPDEQTVTVKCQKGDWEVESLEDWCKVVSVDKAFKEVQISCAPNFTGRERKCLVYFTNDRGSGSVTDIPLQIRQSSEKEILQVKDGYSWREPDNPNFLHLEATGDLVIVDLDCNTQWQVVHKPDGVDVSDDNGDMSKLVIHITPVNAMGLLRKVANKAIGSVEKDYITIATVNQDVRLTIQTEKDKLGRSDEEKMEMREKREKRKSSGDSGPGGISDKTEVEKIGEIVESVETK